MRGYRISLLDSVNLFVIAFVSFVLATSLKTLTPPLAQALGTKNQRSKPVGSILAQLAAAGQRARGQSAQGHDEDRGAAGHQARRCHIDPEGGHERVAVHEDARSGMLSAGNVQDQPRMEEEQGQWGQSEKPTAKCASQVLPERNDCEAGEGGKRPGHKGSGSQGRVGGGGLRGAPLELPAVRQGKARRASGSKSEASPACQDTGKSAKDSSVHHARRGTKVPCHETDGEPVHGSSGGLHAGGGAQRRPVEHTLRCHDGACEQHGVEPNGKPHEAGLHGPISTGQSLIADACRAVRSLKLLNGGNFCYQNSLVMGLLWMHVHVVALQRGHEDSATFADMRSRACLLLRHLLNVQKPIRLGQIFEWTRYMAGWRQPHKQHDVAEFATYLFSHLRPESLEGSWQSRKQCGEVCDVGDTMTPIFLPAVSGMTGMQTCVAHWSQQDKVHALVNPPAVLLVQLDRFVRRNRAIRKRAQDIVPGDIRVPKFAGTSNEVEMVDYTLLAFVTHLGTSPHAGHYRMVLLNRSEGAGELSVDHVTAYYTDDACDAVEISDIRVFARDAYLFWFMRSDLNRMS